MITVQEAKDIAYQIQHITGKKFTTEVYPILLEVIIFANTVTKYTKKEIIDTWVLIIHETSKKSRKYQITWD